MTALGLFLISLLRTKRVFLTLVVGGLLLFGLLGAGTPTTYGQTLSLIWSDEFNSVTSSNVDTTKWTFEIGNGCPNLCGWGNSELETYTSSTNNVYVANGMLHIVARHDGSSYTSARLKTQGLFAKKYGRFEFRAKLPHGQGYWPALWLLPRDSVYGGWAASGEIDIMENKGSSYNVVGGTIHYGGQYPSNTYNGTSYTVPTSVTNFHVYALEWTTNSIKWYVDDVLFKTSTSWYSSGGSYPAPFDQYFYILMNLAIGGNYGGNPDGTTVFPGEMDVDYVRVYDFGVPTPSASFTGSPTNGTAPLTVTFSDTSTGSITNRFWNFGNSGTSNTTATSVQHIYNAAGTNTVTLIVSGSGGSSTNTKPNYIVVTSSLAPPVVLSVTPSCGPTTGGTAGTITGSNFVSGATVTIGGTAASNVVFVSGTTLTGNTPTGTAGAKNVVVTNPSTQSGTLINGFSYTATPSPSNNGPICSGQTLSLFANTNAASYSWTGPNGFTSTTQNPSIPNATTAAAGTYNLTVGCAAAVGATTAAVNSLPNSHNVTGGGAYCSGGTGVTVGLDGSDTGVRYQLVRNSSTNVGSPVAGTGSAISFGNQTAAGPYTVIASNATTACTLAMSGSATVTVNPLPTVTTTPSGSTNICNGSSVTLTAAGASTYSWLPATGLDTTSGATVHASPGSTTTYTVTGTDANGCQNTTNVTVTVNPVLTSTVSPAGATICVGNSQTFTSNPSGGTGPYTYSWTGPNGHSAVTSSITISNAQTADAGSYSVVVTDAKGCAASSSATLTVNQTVIPSAPAITTPGAGFCINAANAAAFTVGGTADTNVPIQIFANATLIGATTTDGAGNWSTNLNFTAQPDGSMSLTATATNNCNSSSPSSALNGTKDVTAPSFAGLDTAVAAIEGATLTWSAAVDSNALTYSVFQATISGAENYATPVLVTNALSAFIAPMYPGSNSPITYFFVVRAADGCGNSESNTVEQSIQPLLDPNKDQDGDGMPNGFEQQYGLNPFSSADANADTDGDGMSNLQEFLAGTDPTNSASVFRITSIVPQGTDLLITWATGIGRTNALQFTLGAAGSYSNDYSDLFIVTNVTGTGTNYLDLGGATNFPSRYYRVRLVP